MVLCWLWVASRGLATQSAVKRRRRPCAHSPGYRCMAVAQRHYRHSVPKAPLLLAALQTPRPALAIQYWTPLIVLRAPLIPGLFPPRSSLPLRTLRRLRHQGVVR